MADYDWYKDCCGAGLTSPHKEMCKENPAYAANVRKREKVAAAQDRLFVCIDYSKSLWGCEQCGVVVWMMDLHRGEGCPLTREPSTVRAATPPRCPDCQAYIYEDQEHACRS